MRPSTPCCERFDRAARRLTVEAISTITDAGAAARLEARLRADCRWPSRAVCHGGRELFRVFKRQELGELIAAATNRARMLARGRTEPKPKGATLDPARLPDDRLDWLIQRHADMAVVDALRAERQRRQEIAA